MGISEKRMNLLAKFDNLFICAILCVHMAVSLPIGTPGTWNYGGLQLPDLGFTEALASSGKIPSNQTTVNPQVINPTGAPAGQGATFPTYQQSGQTQGVMSSTQPTSGGSSTPNGQSSTGGGGDSPYTQLKKIVTETGGNPDQKRQLAEMEAQMKQSQGPSEAEINSIYQPTQDYLNQAESAVRNDFPNVLDAAQKAYESAIGELTNSKNKNLTTIGENTLQAGNRKEDALTSARRLYDELRRGYSQRFGGSTSAGQAATELASVEQQRQMGATNRQYSDTVRQIDQQKVQLEQDYSLGQQKILESKTQAIAQANRDFQNKLLEIQGKRAETESAKAQAKLSALQELRNRAYQAQQEALTYQQNLDMFYKQQQADLTSYAQKLQMAGQGSSSAINAFLGGTTTNPTSTLQVGSSGGQNTTPTLTGIKTSKEDELRGAINQKIDPYGIQKLLYGN